MRKAMSIVLCVVVLLTVTGSFTACEKQKPLRILIDIDWSYGEMFNGYSIPEEMVTAWYEDMKMFVEGTPEDVVFEIVPDDREERQMMLTRIRTEVMAGEGPDLFIAESSGQNPLFLMPEKSKELGLFYRLDDFIENAQFMEWDKLNPVVMQAGYSEKWGWTVMPLAYTFPVTFFRKSEVPEAPKGYTWQDVVNDETGILQAASGLRDMGGIYGNVITSFPAVADYETRKLLFTEEELLQRMKEYVPFAQKHKNGDFEALPDFFKCNICAFLEHWNWNAENSAAISEEMGYDTKFHDYITNLTDEYGSLVIIDEPLTMVPAYNDAGGITAAVTVFGAVNANSKRAKDAFFFLDYLLSAEGQSRTGLARRFTTFEAIPVYDSLMQEDTPIRTLHGEWYLFDENYAEFCRLREQITSVRIVGQLDEALNILSLECVSGSAPLEEYVHEYYSLMQKEVSE